MTCEGSAGEEAGILNAMLHRAGDLGADGIILNGAKPGADGRTDVLAGWGTLIGNSNRAYRAQAIRFKASSEASPTK